MGSPAGYRDALPLSYADPQASGEDLNLATFRFQGDNRLTSTRARRLVGHLGAPGPVAARMWG